MRAQDEFIVKEIVRQELLKSRDIRISENSRSQMERTKNVRLFTSEKDDNEGYRTGGDSNDMTAG